MKPTGTPRSVEKDGSKMKHINPSIPRPKHSTTITVGGSGARPHSSSSLTTPLERRLSGDLAMMVGGRSGAQTDDRGGGDYLSTILATDGRRKAPTLIAFRDKQGKQGTRPVSMPSTRPPPAFKTSTKSPRQAFTSPVKSPSLGESESPLEKPAQRTLPRSNSGGSAAVSPDLAAVRVNGHPSNGVNDDDSDNNSYNLTDFYDSLPSLPADEFLSPQPPQRGPMPSPAETVVSKISSASTSSQPPALTQSQLGDSPAIETNQTVPSSPPPSLPNHSVPSPDSRRPDSAHRKSRKSFRPPPMGGIAENGAFVSELAQERRTTSIDDVDIPAETFHVNLQSSGPSAGGGAGEGKEEDDDELVTFAGRRDVKDTRSLHEKQIVSAKGTVRGFKNRVRAGIATFIDQSTNKFNYRALERGQIVVYITSVTVVRETNERCKRTRNILHTHMVRYEQRDVYMSQEHQRQLRERLGSHHHDVPLPQIFIDGIHLGGCAELEKLNESGELRKILHRFPKIQKRSQCDTCGGYRFVPCGVCHGSKKSVHRNHFTEEFCALRCMHCNESGLHRCQDCLDQQE